MRSIVFSAALLALAGASASAPAALAQTCPTCLPLDHVGGAPHRGWPLGLYEPGSNSPPAAHQALALAAAAEVVPRDAAGAPSPHGLIGWLAFGMSNTNQEFAEFERREDLRAGRNARLVVVDAAVGGQSADVIQNPAAPYWNTVAARVAAAGLDPDQVQVAWLKQADGAVPDTSFPAHAETLQAHLHRIVRDLKQRFPQLRLCYLSSRIYGGYSGSAARSEPLSLEGGFSMRWLIAQQASGDPLLNADPDAGAVVAPVLLWGPYLWANGTQPRASDGLMWARADLESDAVHPSPSGEAKVAALLQGFLAAEPTAATWRNAATGEGVIAIDPEADAWVDDTSPSVNHGADSTLVWSNPARRAYVRFDLSGVTPATVFHAKLSMRTPADVAIGGVEVVGVTQSGWSEATITAANAPPLDGPSFGMIPSASRGTAVSLDVTDAVQAAIAAGPPARLSLGLRLAAGPASTQAVLSRESGEAPRLLLSIGPSTVRVTPPRPAPRLRIVAESVQRTGPAHAAIDTPEPLDSAELDVLDVSGRRLATLHAGSLPAGRSEFRWDGDAAGAGLHFLRLRATTASGERLTLTRKLVRLGGS